MTLGIDLADRPLPIDSEPGSETAHGLVHCHRYRRPLCGSASGTKVRWFSSATD